MTADKAQFSEETNYILKEIQRLKTQLAVDDKNPIKNGKNAFIDRVVFWAVTFIITSTFAVCLTWANGVNYTLKETQTFSEVNRSDIAVIKTEFQSVARDLNEIKILLRRTSPSERVHQ